jgi:hypothetical protein
VPVVPVLVVAACRAVRGLRFDRAGLGAVGRDRPSGQREDGSTARAVVGIVQLDEGPWWWAQLRTDDPAVLAVGDRVVVAFERSGDDSETVPVFATLGP